MVEAQRTLFDPVPEFGPAPRWMPEGFVERALREGHDPSKLRPTETTGLWVWTDNRGQRPIVRHFRWRDVIDPGAPGYRPGGAHRTWREHRLRASRVRGSSSGPP